MFQGIPDLHRLRLFAPCIPLSGYVRFSPRERRAFTDGFPAVQNGLYEIQKGNNLTFASLLVFPS